MTNIIEGWDILNLAHGKKSMGIAAIAFYYSSLTI